MKVSERQWNAQAALVCHGDEPHIAPLPDVRLDDGVMADLRCAECGEAMDLVHMLTIARNATLNDASYHSRPPLYTTAKLHPLAAMSAMQARSA